MGAKGGMGGLYFNRFLSARGLADRGLCQELQSSLTVAMHTSHNCSSYPFASSRQWERAFGKNRL